MEQHTKHLKAMRKVAEKTLDYDDADEAVSACIKKILATKAYVKTTSGKLRGFLCTAVYFARLDISRAQRKHSSVFKRLPDNET